MVYYNTRRLIESLIVPLAFISMAKNGIRADTDDAKAGQDQVINLLMEAGQEIIPKNITLKEGNEIYRRSNRVVNDVVLRKFVENNQLAAKLGITMYYFINNMLIQGAYYIDEEGPLQKALDLIYPALGVWINEKALDASAFKMAKNMLDDFHKEGYFRDINWTIDIND